MYRKIILAVDCDNEQDQQLVQNIAQEVCQTYHISAKDIISFYPVVRQNKDIIYTAFKTISREGKKGIMKIVPLLMKKL